MSKKRKSPDDSEEDSAGCSGGGSEQGKESHVVASGGVKVGQLIRTSFKSEVLLLLQSQRTPRCLQSTLIFNTRFDPSETILCCARDYFL